MVKAELLPYEQQATRQAVWAYQRKIDLLLYAAITTWVDIAFAVSQLARFLTNSSPEHHVTVD